MNDVEPLPQEIEIEKVVDEENTKTFRVVATIWELPPNCIVEFKNPTPVFDSSGKQIGFVNLYRDGRTVDGEFFLDYATPERLGIETATEKLYPHTFSLGVFLSKEPNDFDPM